MMTLKYFLVDYVKHKARVHQLDFIGAFLQANFKHGFFVKLESRYGEFFPKYCNYLGRSLILKKSMYVMTNSENIFSGELTCWLIY